MSDEQVMDALRRRFIMLGAKDNFRVSRDELEAMARVVSDPDRFGGEYFKTADRFFEDVASGAQTYRGARIVVYPDESPAVSGCWCD